MKTGEWLILAQLTIILAAARLGGWIGSRWLAQTAVAGEILAGIVLGPTVMAKLLPGFFQMIFPTSSWATLKQLSELGLILLMFQVGLEFDVKHALATRRNTVIGVAIAAAAVPFVVGFVAAPFFFDGTADGRHAVAFRLFFSLALSITAIPILGRIFTELNITHHTVACIAIGAAAIDDVLGWLALSVITAFASARLDERMLLTRLALLCSFLVFVVAILAPKLRCWTASAFKAGTDGTTTILAGLLILLFMCAIATASLGVFGIIGAFALGYALHGNRNFLEIWQTNVGKLTNILLAPVFFVTTGLRLQVDTITNWHSVIDIVCIVALAFIGKFVSTYLTGRFFGESRNDAFILGISMNTRALMELIVLNIGLDLHVFSPRLFTYLVLMAIISTLIATPLIRLALSKHLNCTSNTARVN